MRWVIEYMPEGSDMGQHVYCTTEQEVCEGAGYPESVGGLDVLGGWHVISIHTPCEGSD